MHSFNLLDLLVYWSKCWEVKGVDVLLVLFLLHSVDWLLLLAARNNDLNWTILSGWVGERVHE